MREVDRRQNPDVDLGISESCALARKNHIAGNAHGHATTASRSAHRSDRLLAGMILRIEQIDVELLQELPDLFARFAKQNIEI